jgi:hypothetical protein
LVYCSERSGFLFLVWEKENHFLSDASGDQNDQLTEKDYLLPGSHRKEAAVFLGTGSNPNVYRLFV